MLTLSILRHAKSSWDDYDLSDHERPLSKRGTRAAADVGRHIVQSGRRPELILSSDSVRTRGTVAILLSELGAPAPEVFYESSLYLAEPVTLVGRLRRVDSDIKHVMLVGHNPGLHAISLSLIGNGDRKDLQRLAMKFPTAGLVTISFPEDDWSNIKPGAGTLMEFITPRELA
jgi:phosphohistidine phosphatase